MCSLVVYESIDDGERGREEEEDASMRRWLELLEPLLELPGGFAAALRNSDEKVGKFVNGAWSACYELVVVVRGGAKDREVQAKYEMRRENEILHEKKGVCLGADLFLAESFRSRGIRVVKPISVDTNDVIAAIARAHSGAIVVSKNSAFAHYDKPLVVSRNFTVKKGKLLLEEPRTQCNARWGKSIERALALHDETWCGGHENKYRGSLRINRRIEFGSTSSSDRKMGNLHVIARPLRAAVYATLGEDGALERIPEWNNDDKIVVWTETAVTADHSLVSVLHNPIAALEWLVSHDTAVNEEEMEPWKAAERQFNLCCLAADLVTAASKGAWTVHKGMVLFSKEPEVLKRTTVDSPSHATPSSTHDARARLPLVLKPPTTPASAENVASPSSTSRPSIFGVGRPREEVRLPISGSGSVGEEVRPSIFGTGRPREEVLKERKLWR